MRQIRPRLVERTDAEVLRGLTVPQRTVLREDEPDPVAALRARAQLGAHPVVNIGLGVDESLQVERIGHGSTVPHTDRVVAAA